MRLSTPSRHDLRVFFYAVACTLTCASNVVYAGPEGGAVVGGAGSITQSGVNTTINQTSQNMAINW